MFYKVAHNRGKMPAKHALASGRRRGNLARHSSITSAVLDRLLHHAETVLLKGSTYRMKDRIETLQPSS